jgi:GAF domain-containing protein
MEHHSVLSDAEASLERANDVEAVGLVVRGAARELSGADGSTFVLAEGASCFYEDEDAIAPLWKGQRFPMSACLSGWAMLHDEVVRVRDVELDDRVPIEAYRPTFVRSLAIVPVGWPAIAAIGAYWARHHLATDDEVTRLRALAEKAAAALGRVDLATAPWAPDLRTP